MPAGCIARLERQLDQQRANLTHIDGALGLFEPDRDPGDIKPKRTYARRTRYFAKGELSRLVLEALRDARGKPLSTDDMAGQIIAAKGFDAADSVLRGHPRSGVDRIARDQEAWRGGADWAWSRNEVEVGQRLAGHVFRDRLMVGQEPAIPARSGRWLPGARQELGRR